MRAILLALLCIAAGGCAAARPILASSHASDLAAPRPAPRMVVVDQRDVSVDQPPPHGAIGMSTAYRISDAAPGRTMEFRRRVLHAGAAIGEHPIDHDEVYYVLAGQGEVISDGEKRILTLGMAAYLYDGAVVGIRQLGETPQSLAQQFLGAVYQSNWEFELDPPGTRSALSLLSRRLKRWRRRLQARW